MKYLIFIFFLLFSNISYSQELYVCQPIAKTNISDRSTYGDHIREDGIIGRIEKPKLLKISKTKVSFGDWELRKTKIYNIFRYSSDIFHLYQTGTNKNQKVLMYYYVNANGPRNTFKQESKMYYCNKS